MQDLSNISLLTPLDRPGHKTKNYQTTDEVLGYATKPDPTNIDPRFLVDGSKNVIINEQEKVSNRNGYTRVGASNTALTAVRSATTWNTSTGTALPMRVYDDELEVYLATIDGVAVNAWTRVMSGLDTSNLVRFTTWWDTAETLDLLLFVISDSNIYEWSGLVTTIASATTDTITKNGTDTWAQARAATAGTTQVQINGTTYTYTGGEDTTTLTGVTPDPTGEAADSVVTQTIVTNSDQPASTFTNDSITTFENQVCVGSNKDNEVYISKNTSFTDYTFSSPRVPGEGALLVQNAPTNGLGALGSTLITFSGRNDIYTTQFQQLDVGGTLSETMHIRKLETGVNQSAQSHDVIIPMGNAIAYLSYEPALRIIETPTDLEEIIQRTISDPIKPDFDAETWTNAHGLWHRNRIYLSAPSSSKLYIFEFARDANGKRKNFWQAPQTLPVRALSIISEDIHGHSNAVPETYKLFDGLSDTSSDDDKLPINAVAKFAYRLFGKRANLKNFDEYYVEGEISASTKDLSLILNYDFGGFTQQIEKTIDGTDSDIVFEPILTAGFGQSPFGQQPYGGALEEPTDTPKFHVIFEIAREDFHELQAVFETNEIDRQWSILAHGPNAKISPRINTVIKK